MRTLSTIHPYAKNPRKNDGAVDAVAESIRQFGFRQPIVVDGDGVIVCGHTRYKAARKLGLTEVPVHVAADLSPERVKALRMADNKTSELAEWDVDLLADELGELTEFNFEDFGFGKDELSLLTGRNVSAVGSDSQGKIDGKSPEKCPKCGYDFIP